MLEPRFHFQPRVWALGLPPLPSLGAASVSAGPGLPLTQCQEQPFPRVVTILRQCPKSQHRIIQVGTPPWLRNTTFPSGTLNKMADASHL